MPAYLDWSLLSMPGTDVLLQTWPCLYLQIWGRRSCTSSVCVWGANWTNGTAERPGTVPHDILETVCQEEPARAHHAHSHGRKFLHTIEMVNMTTACGQHRHCLCRQTQQLSKCIQSLGTSQILRPPHKQTLLVIWKILQAMRFCLCALCSFAQAGRRRGIMPSAICPTHLARPLLVLIQCMNNMLSLHRVYFGQSHMRNIFSDVVQVSALYMKMLYETR